MLSLAIAIAINVFACHLHFKLSVAIEKHSYNDLTVCTSLFISGYKDQVYRKGDKLVVVHSHELHPPALPRKYSIICCTTFSLA